MKVALDTNILAYAEGLNGPQHQRLALKVVARLPGDRTVVPIQVLGELYRVMVGKAAHKRTVARAAVQSWRDSFLLAETTEVVLLDAVDLATLHQLNIWDAMVISASATAGCRLLLSEDLSDGFSWKGLTVTNPFSLKRNALLESFYENG